MFWTWMALLPPYTCELSPYFEVMWVLIYLMSKRKRPLEGSLHCKPACEKLLVRIRFSGRERGRGVVDKD